MEPAKRPSFEDFLNELRAVNMAIIPRVFEMTGILAWEATSRLAR
jgi:hypothetical protein